MSRSMTAYTEPDPTWETCFMCTETSQHDIHLCQAKGCDNYYCDAHGDEERCAECLQEDARDWLGLLDDSENLRRSCNYRVGFSGTASISPVRIPFLTSDAALRFRDECSNMDAEEWDGKRWLPLSEEGE